MRVHTTVPSTETIVTDSTFQKSKATSRDPEVQEASSSSRIPDPAKEIEHKNFIKKLTLAIEQLPAQERLVLALYYHEELTLREIGVVLDLPEGRICQIRAKAVPLLREALGLESVH